MLIGLAALGACAAGGLEADWASMQPLYQQGGLAATWDPLSPGPSTAVRTIDPWDYGNLCAFLATPAFEVSMPFFRSLC